jgi:hypothetical protein
MGVAQKDAGNYFYTELSGLNVSKRLAQFSAVDTSFAIAFRDGVAIDYMLTFPVNLFQNFKRLFNRSLAHRHSVNLFTCQKLMKSNVAKTGVVGS